MNSITFELSKSMAYANGSGKEVECNHIELIEPTGSVSHICCGIEALIQSSVLDMAGKLGDDAVDDAKEAAAEKKTDTEESTDAEKKDGDAMLAVMTGGGCNMEKVVSLFRKLFKEVALMGGEKKITGPRMDNMLHRDFRKMMGEYAANFIMS